MEALLQCFLAHTRGSFLDEALQQCGGFKKKDKQEKEKDQQGAAAANNSGPPHGLREVESFDVKLLALNALTNCAEKSLDSRKRIAGLVLCSEGEGEGAAVAAVPLVQPADSAGASAASSSSSVVPITRFLVQYLLLRIRPFADQLAKVRSSSLSSCSWVPRFANI